MWTEIFPQQSPTTNLLLVSIATILVFFGLSRLWSCLRTPGPWGIPIYGYYWFLRDNYEVKLRDFGDKYGEVYRITVAGQDFLHLGSIRAIREAHVNQAENFSSRPYMPILEIGFNDSLVTMNGEAWRHHRKFLVQCMRDTGLGGSQEQLKGPIEDAVLSTLQTFRKCRGRELNLVPLLYTACTDAVTRLFLGSRVTEEQLSRINTVFLKSFESMSNSNILLVGKFARYFVFPWITGHSELMTASSELKRLFQEIVDDHKSTFDLDQTPKDFVDRYLRERHSREQKDDPTAKYFTDEALIGILSQVYGDGSTSIGLVLGAFLFTLCGHTTVQDDIHEEILRVVGSERLPSLADRAQLPLTMSTMKELLRTVKMFPTFPGLKCSKATEVMGVKVPKGCVTLINFWAAHNDPKTFENPSEFDSTRFHSNRPKGEQPISFGMGKRSCAGEGLVMSEAFLHFAAILQNFLLLPANENISLEEQMKKFDKYEVIVVPRARGRFNSATGNA